MSMVHLHVHTDYSLLDGACRVPDLVARAAELGMPALATTDHGSTSSWYDFQKECDKVGIKPILGTEFYTSSPYSDRKSGHLVVLAKNAQGIKNIFKLQEYAYTKGFRWKPRVDFRTLCKYKEGLIVTSACLANTINQHIMKNEIGTAMAEIKEYHKEFGDDFYLELQSNHIDEQQRVNEILLSFAKELGIKTILTNDVHYVLKDDWYPHEVLLALQTKKKMSDENRFTFSVHDFWLKSEEEMRVGIEYLDDADIDVALENTLEIASKCNARLEYENHLPKFYNIPDGVTARQLLVEEAKKGIINKSYKDFVGDIQNEINVVDGEGLSDYFLIVQDYIRSARENNVIVGDGRGSGSGSKLAYVMDIHRVQPDKYNLLFERFLAPGRTPDIDVDFSDQEFVFRDLQKKYGKENVAHIMTFGKMTPKAVSRKIFNCFGFSQFEIKRINSNINDNDNSIQEALDRSPELRAYKAKHENIFRVIERLENVISHTGQHAGGILIVKDLAEKFPVVSKDGDYIVAFDKKMVEALGGWKFDVLGLETLPTVRRCLDNIEANHNIVVDLYDIDYDDPKVYDSLCKGDVSGVFQLGNQAGKVMEQRPKNFSDLIAINALIRPGVGDWNEYLERRAGKVWAVEKEQLSYMSDTSGVLTYQEQYLLDAKTFAGWDIAYADKHLRKNKDISNDVETKDKFIEDAYTYGGCDTDKALAIWQNIENAVSGGYSFNKAHSASYAMLSFQTAWLKTYYPTEWYASLMTGKGDDQDAINGLVAECKAKGIPILPPNINESTDTFRPTKEGILYRITTISHVGKTALQDIYKLRPIKSFKDLIGRRTQKHLNDRAVVNLIKAGALDEFGERHDLLWQLDMHNRKKTDVKNGVECDRYDDSQKQRTEWEKEALGMYLSTHPMEKYSFKPLDSFENESNAFIGGEVAVVNKALQRNGKEMAFVTIDTEYGMVRCLVFASSWADKGNQLVLSEGSLVLIRGRRSGDSIIFNSAEEL